MKKMLLLGAALMSALMVSTSRAEDFNFIARYHSKNNYTEYTLTIGLNGVVAEETTYIKTRETTTKPLLILSDDLVKKLKASIERLNFRDLGDNKGQSYKDGPSACYSVVWNNGRSVGDIFTSKDGHYWEMPNSEDARFVKDVLDGILESNRREE